MILRPSRTIAAVLLLSLTALAPNKCGNPESRPVTVADILVAAGSIKRDFRAQNKISPQTDLEITDKLIKANTAYRNFINDELARLANGSPEPSTRTNAVRILAAVLRELQDPARLGIKDAHDQALWKESMKGVENVLIGLDALSD